MRRLLLKARFLLVASVIAAPLAAQAVPISYGANATGVTITLSSVAGTHLTLTNVPFTGYVTFDDAVPEVTNLNFAIGSQGPHTLTLPYAGYDNVILHGATLGTVVGYDGTNVVLQAAGPPADNYFYNIGPLQGLGTFSASDSGGPPPPNIVNQPFTVPFPNATGTIFVNTVTGNLTMMGITIGVVPNPIFGNLVIKGDFHLAAAIPEPGTAVLLGIGLVGLLAGGRWARRSNEG